MCQLCFILIAPQDSYAQLVNENNYNGAESEAKAGGFGLVGAKIKRREEKSSKLAVECIIFLLVSTVAS